MFKNEEKRPFCNHLKLPLHFIVKIAKLIEQNMAKKTKLTTIYPNAIRTAYKASLITFGYIFENAIHLQFSQKRFIIMSQAPLLPERYKARNEA